PSLAWARRRSQRPSRESPATTSAANFSWDSAQAGWRKSSIMASGPDAPPNGVSHGAAAVCTCRHGVAQDTVLEGIVADLALAVPIGKGRRLQVEFELMPGSIDRHFAEVSAGAQYGL